MLTTIHYQPIHLTLLYSSTRYFNVLIEEFQTTIKRLKENDMIEIQENSNNVCIKSTYAIFS